MFLFKCDRFFFVYFKFDLLLGIFMILLGNVPDNWVVEDLSLSFWNLIFRSANFAAIIGNFSRPSIILAFK